MNERDSTQVKHRWIVSPLFDLCFIVNVWWLLFLLGRTASVGVLQSTPIEFWQIYFITTPHRWITLLLVAFDPDRREGRTQVFVAIAAVTALIVAGVWISVGSLMCLVFVDYTWNAWHFASQHGGLLRIYSRMAGGGRPTFERWGFRIYITYIALRAGAWLIGYTEASATAHRVVSTVDLVMLSIPCLMLGIELIDRPWQRFSKVLYMASVLVMYTVFLFAIRSSDRSLAFVMSAATSAFHAVEYMAIVTFYAWRRQESGSKAGLFRQLTRQWLRILAVFMIAVGILSQYTDRNMQQLYLGLNLWAAFLHYAYDGMIWKLRRPATAASLNAQVETTSTS